MPVRLPGLAAGFEPSIAFPALLYFRAVPMQALCQLNAGTQQMLLGTGVSVWRGGQRDYLLSASTRRSTSSSTLPVLGRWRWSSRSLSSALVRPS
jgi:hypothetical protein